MILSEEQFLKIFWWFVSDECPDEKPLLLYYYNLDSKVEIRGDESNGSYLLLIKLGNDEDHKFDLRYSMIAGWTIFETIASPYRKGYWSNITKSVNAHSTIYGRLYRKINQVIRRSN